MQSSRYIEKRGPLGHSISHCLALMEFKQRTLGRAFIKYLWNASGNKAKEKTENCDLMDPGHYRIMHIGWKKLRYWCWTWRMRSILQIGKGIEENLVIFLYGMSDKPEENVVTKEVPYIYGMVAIYPSVGSSAPTTSMHHRSRLSKMRFSSPHDFPRGPHSSSSLLRQVPLVKPTRRLS